MATRTWRESAALHISEAAAEWLEAQGKALPDLLRLTDGERKDLLVAISAAYPYGRRENHPYQIWLDEVKKFRQRITPSVQADPPTEGLFSAR